MPTMNGTSATNLVDAVWSCSVGLESCEVSSLANTSHGMPNSI